MTRTRFFMLGLIVLFATSLFAYYLFFRTASAPWQESGHFVLVFRTAPGVQGDYSLGFGIDDFKLITSDGSYETVTIRSRRITLNPGSDELELVLDTEVPTGTYSGFDFTLRSPELRNSWEGDMPPSAVTLGGEVVRLSVPYRIDAEVTSAVILAFETQNVIKQNNGEFVFLPVIQVETRNGATVKQVNGSEIEISGGTIQHSATFGMDWNGVMRYNFRPKDKSTTTKETTPKPNVTLPNTDDMTPIATEEGGSSSTDDIHDEQVTATSSATDTPSLDVLEMATSSSSL